MPNTVPANAQGLPAINRRRLLGGIAAVSTASAVAGGSGAVAATAEAPVGNTVDAGLLALLDEHDAAAAVHQQARDDLDWLLAEWSHHWPLAPEEILGVANADKRDDERAERDLAGNFVIRDRPNLKQSWRGATPAKSCYSVDTEGELSRWLECRSADRVWGRTEATRARRSAQHDAQIQSLQRRIQLARQYEAETARIREASGVAKAKALVAEARAKAERLADAVRGYPAATFADLTAKAEFFNNLPLARRVADGHPTNVLTFGWAMAQDVRRIASKGGAA